MMTADASMHLTKDWPSLRRCRGMMARPWLWDPSGEQLNGPAHVPLYVSVGNFRGRSTTAIATRSQRAEEKKDGGRAAAKARQGTCAKASQNKGGWGSSASVAGGLASSASAEWHHKDC